jgi:hypothetical protein
MAAAPRRGGDLRVVMSKRGAMGVRYVKLTTALALLATGAPGGRAPCSTGRTWRWGSGWCGTFHNARVGSSRRGRIASPAMG